VTAEDLPALEVPFLFPLPCPHCGALEFEPHPVSKHSRVRSYKDERADAPVEVWPSSPVRVGDSFEKLQRKMLKFSDSRSFGSRSEPLTPAESVTEFTDTEDEGARCSSSCSLAEERQSSITTVVDRYTEDMGGAAEGLSQDLSVVGREGTISAI
jgi:hypothetical protein